MKSSIFIYVIFFNSFFIFSQQNSELVVPENKNLREVLSNSIQYIESDFLKGIVYFNDGTSSEGFFNYNLLLDEIHYIEPDNQGNDRVLALANQQSINFVSFGKRLFLFNKKYGFLEVLYNGNVKLLKKSKLVIESPDKPKDSYGNLSEAAATSKVNSFQGENFNYSPDREKYIVINSKLIENYYSFKSENVKAILTKHSLLKLFSKEDRERLQEILDQFPGKWNDEENLIHFFKEANQK